MGEPEKSAQQALPASCRPAIRVGALGLDGGKQVGEGAQTDPPGAPEELKTHLLGAAAQICAWTQGSACMLRSSEAATVTRLVTSQIVRRNHVVAKSGETRNGQAKVACGPDRCADSHVFRAALARSPRASRPRSENARALLDEVKLV